MKRMLTIRANSNLTDTQFLCDFQRIENHFQYGMHFQAGVHLWAGVSDLHRF